MRVVFLFTVLLINSFWSIAQPVFESGSDGYYVIVGAFAKQSNAERYHVKLKNQGVKAQYAFLPSRKLFYVYTLRNSDADVCYNEVLTLRKQEQFSDAWVRYISGTGGADTVRAVTTIKKPEVVTPTPVSVTTTEPATPQPEEPKQELFIPENVTLENTEIFLSLYNARNDRVANGKVQVIDADRGRLITEVPGNTYLNLPDPKNNSGTLILICDVVGYRKVQKEINYKNPRADETFIVDMGTSLVANFELVQYEKGDIRTLYNIYFYNDAAVMMPESKFELNSLLQMMKDNPTFKIRLHGHTNGHYSGKIIKRGSSGDFFSIAQDAVSTVGTAKQLSEARAEIIKAYLVENGVDDSRVEVKAWGGKRPLHDKKGPNAKKNIRVEVEVISG